MPRYEIPRGYLSASSIATLLRCPKQYEFRYVQNIKKPQNFAMAVGSITHHCFQDYYDEVLQGTRMPSKVLAEYANDAVIPEYFVDNEVTATDSEKESTHYIVPALTIPYVDNVGVTVDPIATEEEIRYTMSCGVDILAYLDLRKKNSGDSQGIADYKITDKFWKSGQLENSLQFNLYSYITGINDVEIHNLIKGKPPKSRTPLPSGVEQPADNIRLFRGSFDVSPDWMENLVERCAAQITSGIFSPCDPGNWCCRKEWCDYWDLCRGKKS